MVADTEDVYSMPASSLVSITRTYKIKKKSYLIMFYHDNVTIMIFIEYTIHQTGDSLQVSMLLEYIRSYLAFDKVIEGNSQHVLQLFKNYD